jgi:GxxExxY protein
MTENEIGTSILKHAYDIHTELGPGLLESVYEVILAHALQNEGISVERQKAVPITYKGLKFDEGFRADVIAESKVIIEIKSVEALLPVHAKQLLTYLKLSGLRLGYLINFREPHLKAGIKRIVNRLET